MIFEPKTYLSNIPKSGIVEFKTIDQLFYLLLKKNKNQPCQSRNSIYQDTYSLFIWKNIPSKSINTNFITAIIYYFILFKKLILFSIVFCLNLNKKISLVT